MELKDSVSIITGGASGLGEATSRKFHSLGSKVCIFDLDNFFTDMKEIMEIKL